MQSSKEDKEQSKYTWTNKKLYTNSEIQTLGEKVLVKTDPEKEKENVQNLFSKILKRSSFALISINDQTGQLALHNIPSQKKTLQFLQSSAKIQRSVQDSQDYFNHMFRIERFYGEKGTKFQFSVFKNSPHYSWGISYGKTFWERVNNFICTNKDQIQVRISVPIRAYNGNLLIGIGRASRQNYLKIFNSSVLNSAKYFGETKDQISSLKHSNLLSLQMMYTQSFFAIYSLLGGDFGNSSIHLKYGLKLHRFFDIGSRYGFYINLQAEDMIGQNILENDLFFRNHQNWPGSRSTNFITPRAQFIFKQYPYLSNFNLNPYIYLQGWGVLSKNLARNKINLQIDYGIGIKMKNNQCLDISLFKLSALKQGKFPFANIKFSF